jgi:hypothetical protein
MIELRTRPFQSLLKREKPESVQRKDEKHTDCCSETTGNCSSPTARYSCQNNCGGKTKLWDLYQIKALKLVLLCTACIQYLWTQRLTTVALIGFAIISKTIMGHPLASARVPYPSHSFKLPQLLTSPSDIIAMSLGSTHQLTSYKSLKLGKWC